VASRHTDCAIPAPISFGMKITFLISDSGEQIENRSTTNKPKGLGELQCLMQSSVFWYAM
jgi:hypothetical protein